MNGFKKTKFTSILFLLFILLFTFSYADNEPNNICTNAETIEELDGATLATSHTESGTVHQIDDEWDIYRFQVNNNGELDFIIQADRTWYSVFIETSCGAADIYSATWDGSIKNPSAFSVSSGQTIFIRIQRRYNTWMSYNMSIDFAPYTPPIMGNIPDEITELGASYTLDMSSYVTLTNGDPISSYALTCLPALPAGLSFDTTSGILDGVPTALGTFACSATATDKDGTSNADAFTITVNMPPPPVATPNSYNTIIDTAISGNVITDIVADIGYGLNLTSHTETAPFHGTLTVSADGNFTYTPDTGFAGTDTFHYTITDAFDRTATALVTITVETDYFPEGFQDFILVNPDDTRNILGDYAIAGNTVMCLTERTSNYGGTCHGQSDYQDITSNLHVSKFIDIDDDTRTWNSTSSYINLPTSYDPKDGKGILWAGLFWQGRFSTDTDYKMHHGMENGASYDLIEMGQSVTYGAIDVSALEANKIKLKVDNGNYRDAQASTVYTYESSGGTTYAAFADVTQILQDANLSEGKRVFTVANLTTNEGREETPGVFGGWSLVTIYAEDFSGELRNISIYHGFQSLSDHPDPIRISGFKLPASGTVSSRATVFSGEGEYLYGRTPTNNAEDWMKISDALAGTYQYMPGPTAGTHVGNRDNMFDATLTGILRDDVTGHSNNLQINNDGVDIDVFNVSSIMTTYRDNNPDINETFLKVDSTNDYVTPSMIAFSAELYKPSVCYDYTIQKNNYDITEPNRLIHSIGEGDLSINVAIQSQEGDFDFTNSQLGIRLIPTADTTFTDAFYAPNNVNTLIPAIHTSGFSTTKPIIAIGENVTLLGGIIKRNRRYFSEFNYELTSNSYDGRFELELNTTVDYGSGPVPIIQLTETGDIERCPQSAFYNPLQGSFNVERPDSGNHNGEDNPELRFPLYTQVVGKDFDFHVVAYNQSATPPFSTELELDGYTVDVELINASPYNDANSTFLCTNPNPNIIQNLDSSGTNNIFAKFDGNISRVNFSTLAIETDTALRNAAFRIWYIVDGNNTILPHECTNANDNACFQILYDTYLKANDNTLRANGTTGFCNTTNLGAGGCSSYTNPKSGKSGCYACLRDFFSQAVCSRDNFAIRPEAYRLTILDTNQSQDSLFGENELGENISPNTVATIAAGYAYKLKGIATSHQGPTVKALGYNRVFATPFNDGLSSTLLFNTSTGIGCADTNDTDWSVRFKDGNITGIVGTGQDINLTSGDLVSHRNVGNYQYYLHDANWTMVDQDDYIYKTFDNVDDCEVGKNFIAVDSTSQSGCNTDSNLTDDGDYENLHLTYLPYRFNLNSVTLRVTQNSAANYMYMNDFDDDYFNDFTLRPLEMAAMFEGNVTALGADNNITTNFKFQCVEHNVILDINRTMSPIAESALVNGNGDDVEFQQYLQTTALTTLNYDFDKVITTDANGSTTITNSGPSRSFSDVSPGSATIHLYTNLKKIVGSLTDCDDTTVNPVDINYTSLRAFSPDANSSADMTNHVPDGNKTYNQKITALFSKITPDALVYDEIKEGFELTAIYVDIFCTTGTCGADYNLTFGTISPIASVGWLSAQNHYQDPEFDGQVQLEADVIYPGTGTNAEVRINNIPVASTEWKKLDNPLDSTRGDINVSISGIRPADVDLIIKPHPWHLYAPCKKGGYPTIRFNFINAGTWAGVGTTGEVVNTDSSQFNAPRMNW